MNLFSLISASKLRLPANTGIGGGNIIEMVLALLTLEEIWVFCVDTILKLISLSLLLLLFWLLLMLATTLLTAAKTDMTVHKNTIWEIPETADSAMEGHPGGAAPPKGRYMTAGPDRSGLVALLLSLFL